MRSGSNPFPTHFEIVPATVMYEFGSYGMPGRFSHWTHGKAYQVQKTMYDYGLSKIYELVINTNPCYAFLLETNTILQNKLVAAHVLAHSDFFTNNAYFQKTSRRMVDTDGAQRRAGSATTSSSTAPMRSRSVLDAVLSIQEHVDPYADRADAQVDQRPATAPAEREFDDLWKLDDDAQSDRRPRQSSSRRRPARRAARARHPPLHHRALAATQGLAARRRRHRARRDALLHPADADEDHERRLGLLLARPHHARARPDRGRIRRVRAASLRRSCSHRSAV